LGRRTIFNLTGPLANPAGVRRQLIGVAQPNLLPIYADAMTELEYDAAMLVAGDEPLDEISVCGPSTCLTLGAQPIRVEPEDLGLTRHAPEALRGGDPAYNAAALQRLLAGETGAYRDAVLINAAAALMVAGHADSLASGVEEAAEALDKGLAKALLDCWIAF
jgi:anthranilate phosphoribosyltransferase